MKYPLIKIEYGQNISEEKKNIIQKYWLLENGKFVNMPTKLNLEFNITQPELNSQIKQSKYFISFGECAECNSLNEIQVTSQTEAKQKLENYYYHFFCTECQNNLRDSVKKLTKLDAKKMRLQHSFKFKLWEKLNHDELNILKIIIKLKTWDRIHRDLMRVNFEYVYKVILRLDNVNLIYYIKDDSTGKIDILFLTELEEILNNEYTNPIKQNNTCSENPTNRIAKTKHISEILRKKY